MELREGRSDEVIERTIVKTIAGFMNAHGGTLLIGVDDDGKAIGLEKDYKLVKGQGARRLRELVDRPP